MWQSISELKTGELFEREDGKWFTKLFDLPHQVPGEDRFVYTCQIINDRSAEIGTVGLSPGTKVRKIDLEFLIACVTDKLQENDAYQRGYRDGYSDASAVRQQSPFERPTQQPTLEDIEYAEWFSSRF